MELPDKTQKTVKSWPTSTDTALCLIPPRELWDQLDRLRVLHDRAYGKWPPHINLIYPFVQPDDLEEASKLISALHVALPTNIRLDDTGSFPQRQNNTIHIRPNDSENVDQLRRLVDQIRMAFGWQPDHSYKPHLTVGQSYCSTESGSHLSLMDKARLLGPVEWEPMQFSLLLRPHQATPKDEITLSQRTMQLWGQIDIETNQLTRPPTPDAFYSGKQDSSTQAIASSRATYHFEINAWKPMSEDRLNEPISDERPSQLVIASYNVLADFEGQVSPERHSRLISTILSARASADLILLEEVTDQFLTKLLADEDVCTRYPYSTHGPPTRPDIGPLPNHLNIAALSRYPFCWSYLSLPRKHKGASILSFSTSRQYGSPDRDPMPLVVAACHLSHGVVDAAIMANKTEVQRILSFLSLHFPESPCIIAGDFNVSTSSYTIDMARKTRGISSQSHRYLRDFDAMVLAAGFQDGWLASRVYTGESSSVAQSREIMLELHEGEQGATFDPQANELARKLVGSGYGNRPQRYDRILVNDRLQLRPRRFNMFGFEPVEAIQQSARLPASDHWGIRCLLERPVASASMKPGTSLTQPVEPRRAPLSLGGLPELKSALALRAGFPTDEARAEREKALKILERALECHPLSGTDTGGYRGPVMILTPVGSFELGVWNDSSDVDCLCIGEISSKVFFKIAMSRLKKASVHGIKILRRVKATSGTMLQLNIRGIAFDLQYCCAAAIAKDYPQVLSKPSSDPVFALPPSTLAKLKPLRDMHYLQRSIPDMAQYRAAHLLIKEWAISRGLYGAKFGLLGGIHISILLTPVCKTLAQQCGSYSVSDVLVTFFTHYAGFDWKTRFVFDPFFHNDLRYHRTFREPLCLLGWHGPSLNTAANSSNPTVETMAREIAQSHLALSQSSMSWGQFIDGDANGSKLLSTTTNNNTTAAFLQAHENYIRVDVHYWGPSVTKGRRFVGWLESRLVTLLVDIDKKLPDIELRLWPRRFSTQNTEGQAADSDSEYQGCFLIGLGPPCKDPGDSTEDGYDARTQELLIDTLRHFETRQRGIAKYYDQNTSWLGATLSGRSELDGLAVDDRQFGDLAGGETEDESSTDDEEEIDHGEDDSASIHGPLWAESLGDRMRNYAETDESRMKPSQRAHGQLTQNNEGDRAMGGSKLRSAGDVMSRIRWDSGLDAGDYTVGYEDRFAGIRERPLEQWKREQTDEEFIPQHRIQYFKRQSDGAVVWERKARRDDIFGSGISTRQANDRRDVPGS